MLRRLKRQCPLGLLFLKLHVVGLTLAILSLGLGEEAKYKPYISTK